MNIPRTVADVLRDHVTLTVESIDRMYLNAVVPVLQSEQGVAWFFKTHRGHKFASSALMAPMTREYVAKVEQFVEREGIPVVMFEKKQRKDDVAKEHLARFMGEEGILFLGKAQEKAAVCRTVRRHNPVTGSPYAWLSRSTAMVNHFYFYAVDRDFGPFFIKFCSYFPYNAKLCINGHEYVKRQLARRGVRFEALDNGILSCEEPEVLQDICDGMSAAKIDALLRKWLRRLPRPFASQDYAAGFDYVVSILQAEFSLTQVLDRPVTGRIFFEEVIRENLDIGRPDNVQLIFGRRIIRRGPHATPERFRTRVITEGVCPSLHFDYKTTRVKQYHKEGRALRTETTINRTYDFAIGKRLHNLPALREVGFTANRRLLDVQRISHDCTIGEDVFREIQRPKWVDDQRTSGLRFGDETVQALMNAIEIFRLHANGFSNADLRVHLGQILGRPVTPGAMSYNLRRLRRHGLIARITGSNRYVVTTRGLRVALFFTLSYARFFRPGLSIVMPTEAKTDDRLRRAYLALDDAMDAFCERARLTA